MIHEAGRDAMRSSAQLKLRAEDTDLPDAIWAGINTALGKSLASYYRSSLEAELPDELQALLVRLEGREPKPSSLEDQG
jgi:hypothetical protein